MSKRKWLIILSFQLLTLAHSAGAQAPLISVNAPDDVDPGSAVEVRIDVSNLTNLGGVVFDLTYDGTRLSLDGVSAEGALAQQGLFAVNPETFPSRSGRVRFGFLSAQGVNGSGTFVKLVFRIASSGAGGENPLPMENLRGVDTNLTDIALGKVDGVLRVLLAVVDVKTGVQFLTIPVQLTRPSPPDVFEMTAAELANKLAVYDQLMNGYRIYGRDPGDYDFLLGRATWIKMDADRRLRIRAGQLADTTQPVAVPLRAGWNPVGNPFMQSVPWSLTALQVRRNGETKTLSEAQQAGWVEDFAWGYQPNPDNPNTGSYYLIYDSSLLPNLAHQLEPMRGHWFLAKVDCELLLPPPPSAVASRALKPRKSSRSDWLVTLSAEAGGAKDSVSFGATSAERNGNKLQISKPPAAPGQGDVQVFLVPHDRAATVTERLGVDVRRSLADKEEWRLIVRSAQPNADVTLRWNDLGTAPRPLRFRLIDETTGVRRYMRTTQGYTFRSGAAGEERKFRIELDGRPQGARLLNHLSVMNNGQGTHFSFVLSQPATVNARIITPTGKVAAMVARGIEGKQGLNALTWNGKSSSGGALARGVYVIEVTAVTEEGQEMREVRTFALR